MLMQARMKGEIKEWLRTYLDVDDEIRFQNFFEDGRALMGILSSIDPENFPFAPTANDLANRRTSMSVLTHKYGVPDLLNPDDTGCFKDEKLILLLLGEMRNCLPPPKSRVSISTGHSHTEGSSALRSSRLDTQPVHSQRASSAPRQPESKVQRAHSPPRQTEFNLNQQRGVPLTRKTETNNPQQRFVSLPPTKRNIDSLVENLKSIVDEPKSQQQSTAPNNVIKNPTASNVPGAKTQTPTQQSANKALKLFPMVESDVPVQTTAQNNPSPKLEQTRLSNVGGKILSPNSSQPVKPNVPSKNTPVIHQPEIISKPEIVSKPTVQYKITSQTSLKSNTNPDIILEEQQTQPHAQVLSPQSEAKSTTKEVASSIKSWPVKKEQPSSQVKNLPGNLNQINNHTENSQKLDNNTQGSTNNVDGGRGRLKNVAQAYITSVNTTQRSSSSPIDGRRLNEKPVVYNKFIEQQHQQTTISLSSESNKKVELESGSNSERQDIKKLINKFQAAAKENKNNDDQSKSGNKPVASWKATTSMLGLMNKAKATTSSGAATSTTGHYITQQTEKKEQLKGPC